MIDCKVRRFNQDLWSFVERNKRELFLTHQVFPGDGELGFYRVAYIQSKNG